MSAWNWYCRMCEGSRQACTGSWEERKYWTFETLKQFKVCIKRKERKVGWMFEKETKFDVQCPRLLNDYFLFFK